jgi:uncharacterized protein YfaS (alpha-2-macroglobulin family)
MSRTLLTRLGILALPLAIIAGLWALSSYFSSIPQRINQHETIVLGQNRLVPGSRTSLRVVVRNSADAAALPDAQVKLLLQPAGGGAATPLFSGVTNSQGDLDVAFTVPPDAQGTQNLVVETTSRLGADRLEQPVTLVRDYRVLLTTDKPLYQPGQTIHMRALALGVFDRRPAAGQDLAIAIADGKGNNVFRQTLKTSDYGVASADFQLASQVNTGAYKITTTLGNTTSEKTITVERYVLPKFKVELHTERPFYLPGAHVRGTLSAQYFFGKPVDRGAVTLEGATFDVERRVAVQLQGSTDANGSFSFEFDLPGYIAGSELEGGGGRFELQASVVDQARQTTQANLLLPVAQSQLVLEAIPEGGQLRPGVDNILYVLASYPDGTPAEASLSISFQGQTLSAQTGAQGLASVHLTPQLADPKIAIQARDSSGNSATREFTFNNSWDADVVLLRPEHPLYRVGETMNLTILSSQPNGTVYLDIVREGQTVSTRAVPMQAGQAQVAVDLTPDLYGTLQLHAYRIRGDGNIVRDTRLVLVDAAADLSLTLTPDREVYHPGDSAGLDVQTNAPDGQGAPSAVGLAIVDESVFALAEQDPGFAKLYFMLEQELLQPKSELHGFRIPDLLGAQPVSDPALRAAQEDAARASLAQAAQQPAGFSLQANSHTIAVQRANEQRDHALSGLAIGLFVLLLLLPLAALVINAAAAWRERRLWRRLGLALVVLVIVLVLSSLAGPLLRFSSGLQLLLLGLAGLGLLGLAWHAWRRGDWALGWTIGIGIAYAGALFFLVTIAQDVSVRMPNSANILGLLALLLLLFALLLRSAGLWSEGLRWAALAGMLNVLALLLVLGGLLGRPVAAEFATINDGLAGGGAAPVLMEAVPAAAPQAAAPQAGANAAAPPRLRQYFPETMYWLPDATTDQAGRLHLDIPLADSITTWRVTALASSQDGRLGSASGALRVFQDFFIDLDLPQSLTAGDEVAVPVGVFNYLPGSQTVRLELAQADWFELLDQPAKEVTIGANDIGVVYFRIRARTFGLQPLKVTAQGSQMSDAIQKELRVFPNGKPITFSNSDSLSGQAPVNRTISIPAAAIPGTQQLMVKLYPGILSQVVEGLDSMLRMPSGCFEQTSSSTYPNVLVLDYLRTTNQASPETQLKAEEYINLGYQRLTTFEVNGGGFSLFGDAPADVMLTAYGLQEFSDMSRVHTVDPALIQRTAEWLLAQQQADGSWVNPEGFHESTLTNQTNSLAVSAYVVWSLVDAGLDKDARLQRGLDYLRQSQTDDPYVLGLVANALVAADAKAGQGTSAASQAALDRLAGMASRQGGSATWNSSGGTFMGGHGQTGDIETTALAALALIRAGSHADLANAALTSLIQQKDSYGTWYNTSATVMTLKALIQSVRSGAENVDASVRIALNGGQAHTLKVTRENFDVVQLVTLDGVRTGDNQVEISATGQGNLMYQVAGEYYLPWEVVSAQAPDAQPVTIDVGYDRAQLAVDDTVSVSVTVRLNQPGQADSALIDLGVPPGFAVQAEDLDALVARDNQGQAPGSTGSPDSTPVPGPEPQPTTPAQQPGPRIERYELTGRQILVYISDLSHEQSISFSYRLRARFPLVAQTPASSAYDYYNPDIAGQARPQVLTVTGN